MSKDEAIKMIWGQIWKADIQHNEYRESGNEKGVAEQKLVIQALLMAFDVVKEITEIETRKSPSQWK